MNKYELALVVSAKIEDDARAAVVAKAQEYVTRAGGVVSEVEEWGSRTTTLSNLRLLIMSANIPRENSCSLIFRSILL